MKNFGLVPHIAGCAILTWASPAAANEGMWMPHQATEIGAAMRADGLQLDPAALARFDVAPLICVARSWHAAGRFHVHR